MNSNFENLSFEELMDSIASDLGDNMVERGLRMLTKKGFLNIENSDESDLDSCSKMAETGFPTAMFQMGERYAKGIRGVQQNYEKAFFWYHEAAKLNHKDAQRSVAAMYKYGLSVYKNTSKFVEWITKAAEKDDLLAKLKLADYYWSNRYNNSYMEDMSYKLYTTVALKIYEFGLTKDSRVVNHIINQANNDYHYAAKCGLATMFEYGIIFPKDEEKARDLYMSTTSYYRAICWERGLGGKKDEEIALQQYTIAAKKGNPRSQLELGDCYLFGELGVAQSYENAFEWYRKALEEHDELEEHLHKDLLFSLVYLAERYMDESDDTPQNYKKAVECLTFAAVRGWPEAQYILGNCYAEGLGVAKDSKKAMELYTEAAKQGNEEAQWKLCYGYLEGEYGLHVSYEKAYTWCAKLCDKDDPKLGNCKSYKEIKQRLEMGLGGSADFRYEVLGFLHFWHECCSQQHLEE